VLNEEKSQEVSHVTVDERIPERIANNYELRLMETLPEDTSASFCMTIITTNGVFQWNSEIEQWKCQISIEELNSTYQDLIFLLQHAGEISDPNGVLAYNFLSLKQLNTLEQALRLRHGNTVIGYSICEEIYLRTINCFVWLFCRGNFEYSYPPLPEQISRRLLTFMARPLVIDIASSLRVAAQTSLLFGYFFSVYFQYSPQGDDDYVEFQEDNYLWFLLSVVTVTALSLLLLRISYVSRAYALSALIRLRMVEQSIIGFASNLTNYGPLIASDSFIKACFLPVVLLGALLGYYEKKEDLINISLLTMPQFLFRTFFSSLTVASFCSLGLSGFITATFFLYIDSSDSANNAFLKDVSYVRYTTLAIMLLVSLFRYPYLPIENQRVGRYASNLMNGISIAMLDNYALFLFIVFSVGTFYGSYNFSPEKPFVPAVFCTLIALSFLAVLLVTFPGTPNIPEYSLEKNSAKPGYQARMFRFFENIISNQQSSLATEIQHRSVSAENKVELKPSGITSFLRRFNRSNDQRQISSTENPLQDGLIHFQQTSC